MSKVLSVKDTTNYELLNLCGCVGIGNQLRHLSLDQHGGVNAVTRMFALCLFHIKETSIFVARTVRQEVDGGKNCFYRMM